MGDGMKSKKPDAAYGSLVHPAFLLALLVLVVNDHLLKGSGLLSGAVTGKLSDVAWLVVAPVVTAALTARAGLAWRYLAGAAPVLFFIALQVSPGLATWVESVGRTLHFPLQVWPDPTDLYALLILPVPAHLVRVPRARGAPARAFSRLTLAVASVACVATSAPEGYGSSASILNHSEGRASFTLRGYDATELCYPALSTLADLLTDDVPVGERDYTLSQGETAGFGLVSNRTCTPSSCPRDWSNWCNIAVVDLGSSGKYLLRGSAGGYSTDRPADTVPLYEKPYDWMAVLRGKPGRYTLEAGPEIEVQALPTDSAL